MTPPAPAAGGPGYQFGVENAPKDGMFPAGSIAMARTSDPNTNGSQFFIVYKDTQLPTEGGGYSIFGTVTKGLDVVEKVAAGGCRRRHRRREAGTTGDHRVRADRAGLT